MTADLSAAVILAAGESRRMGVLKALLPFRGETFLDGLIGKLAVHCRPVIVVLGHEPDRVRSGAIRPAQFVVNPHYRQGMLTSLQCGLRAVPGTCSHAVFTLVDHPNPAGQTLTAVADAQPASVVIPRYRGKKGHPVRLHRTVIDDLLALPPTAKPTDVLYRYLDTTLFLDLDDPGIVDDIDDPAAYEDLLARCGEKSTHSI